MKEPEIIDYFNSIIQSSIKKVKFINNNIVLCTYFKKNFNRGEKKREFQFRTTE